MTAGRPLKFKSVKVLEEKIDKYFKDCDAKEKPYTITGLAVALDTSRETLCNYEKKEKYFDTIKRAKARCEQWVEENMLMNKSNATASIFSLKNNYGWRDKNEVDHTSSDGSMTPSKIEIVALDDNSEG
jgi:hypothetical protein